MTHILHRLTFFVLTILGISYLICANAAAAEVTLRMKGGSFEIKGELKSYDLQKFVVTVPSIGILSLDADRYQCVSGACPTGRVDALRPSKLPFEPVTTTWVGGSAIGTEFMPRLIRAFAASIGATVSMQVSSDVKNLEFMLNAKDGRLIGQVNINRQGVTPGFLAMAQGNADLVWTSRSILLEEEQMMAGAGFPAMRQPGYEHVWALDALLVLVAKENPAVSLSLDSIADIFSGKTRDWGELGFNPGKINVYAPTSEMGTWNYFENTILKKRNLELTKDAVRLEHATEWTDRVAGDPNGIGLNSIAYLRKAKALNLEMTCGIVFPPSTFTAKTEEYPLTRRLYFYTAGQPKNPLASALLEFALSSQVQPVLREASFVDKEPDQQPFVAHTGRIANAINAADEDFDPGLFEQLVQDIARAERLSLTFRFAASGAVLDTRGKSDLSRLSAMIENDTSLAGKTIFLLGFSDSAGPFTSNLAIAQRRAQLVKSSLLRLNPKIASSKVNLVERAYGELAPVACNDTPESRALNRRVEVWIR